MKIDIQIERWPIERLVPRSTNPRTHSKEQIAGIAASIKEWGWTNPILVGTDNDIIAGHPRLAAAQKLEMPEVPASVARPHRPLSSHLRTTCLGRVLLACRVSAFFG